MKHNILSKLPVMLFCAYNSYATDTILTDIANFEKDPVEFFKTNVNKYAWINEDTKKMLVQFPKWENVKEKLVIEKNPENQIKIEEVQDNAKNFYEKLFKDGEKYLAEVANKAINNADLIWSEELIGGTSTVTLVVQGDEDAPPYLRIMDNTTTGWCWFNTTDTLEMTEKEKHQFLEKKAIEAIEKQLQDEKKKDKDDWDNVKITAEYVGEGKNEHSGWDEVKYKITRTKKLYKKQPDFKEIESNHRWPEIYRKEDVNEVIGYEVGEALYLIILDKNNAKYNYYKFKDKEDQEKYDDWLRKIHSRFKDITQISENFKVKVLYTSKTDAEFFLIHEVAHLLENVWLMNSINKRKSSNLETFAVYVEMELGRCKTLRLFDIYQTIIANCVADLMMRIVNLNCTKSRMKAIQKLTQINGLEYYKEALKRFEKNVEPLDEPTYEHKEAYRSERLKIIEQDICQNDLSDHIKALYNAIQLRKHNMTLTQVMENLAEKEPAKLTPENFHELMNFLLK